MDSGSAGRWRLTFACWLTLWLLCAQARGQPLLEGAWELYAYRVEATGFRRFLAEGDAEIRWGERRLSAQRLEGDLESGWVTAQGGVRLVDERGVLYADEARVNLRTREGEMLSARGAVEGIFITAETLRSDGRTLFMQEVTLTTCPRERPDFLLAARSLSLSPSLRLRARRVSLFVGGRRWVTLPTLDRLIGRREPGEPLVPLLGYSRRRGVMLSFTDQVTSRQSQVRYGVRVFARYPPEIGVDWTRRLDRSGEGEPLRHLEPTERRAASFLETVSASRWRLAPQERARQAVFLSLRANSPVEGLQRTDLYLRGAEVGYQTVSPLGRGQLETEWRLGELHETPTRATARRAVGFVRWQSSPWRLGGRLETDLALEGRAGAYSDEQSYRWVRAQWGIYWGDAERFALGAGLSLAARGGRSPFVFDQLETSREVRFRFRWAANWGVDVLASWDIEHARWRDWQVALSPPAHCLQPRILWSSQQRQIQLQLGLASR